MKSRLINSILVAIFTILALTSCALSTETKPRIYEPNPSGEKELAEVDCGVLSGKNASVSNLLNHATLGLLFSITDNVTGESTLYQFQNSYNSPTCFRLSDKAIRLVEGAGDYDVSVLSNTGSLILINFERKLVTYLLSNRQSSRTFYNKKPPVGLFNLGSVAFHKSRIEFSKAELGDLTEYSWSETNIITMGSCKLSGYDLLPRRVSYDSSSSKYVVHKVCGDKLVRFDSENMTLWKMTDQSDVAVGSSFRIYMQYNLDKERIAVVGKYKAKWALIISIDGKLDMYTDNRFSKAMPVMGESIHMVFQRDKKLGLSTFMQSDGTWSEVQVIHTGDCRSPKLAGSESKGLVFMCFQRGKNFSRQLLFKIRPDGEESWVSG